MDFSALKTQIQQNIKTNNNEDITGSVLQGVLLGIVSTLGDDAINDLISALGQEVTNRQNAVQDEADARVAAINNVLDLLRDEVQARQDADAAEHQRAEAAFDDLDMIDAAGVDVRQESINLTLRKNDGSDEDPDWRTLCSILLPSVSYNRAGLMSVDLKNKLQYLINGGYLFQGVAVPASNPGTPHASCFYLATKSGTYTNFHNADDEPIVIEHDAIYVLTYDAVENNYWEWNKVTDFGDGVFDISMYNLTEGRPTTYTDLSEALGMNGANVPAAFRKGGMSVKFIQSSDNNYVQYRYMSSSTDVADFANAANWQGVDEVPTAGSDNLPKSGGVVYFINNRDLKIEKQIEEICHSHDADDDSIKIFPNNTNIPIIDIKKKQTDFNQDLTIRGKKVLDSSLPIIRGGINTEESILITTDDDVVCSEMKAGKTFIDVENEPEILDSVSFGDEDNPSMVITDDYVKINNLRVENVQIWRGKIWATVGDSLVEYNSRSSKFVQQFIQEKRGINIDNVGHSGWGFVDYLYRTEIMNISSNPYPDVITIQSSGNDIKFLKSQGLPLGNITDVGSISYCGYINSTLNKWFELFPTIPLGCITSPPWRVGYPGGQDKTFENMCNAFLEICYNRGIPTLDLFHDSNLHPENIHYRALVYNKDTKCEITTPDTPDAILVTSENIDDLQILSDDTLQIGDYVTNAGGVHPNEIGHYLMTPRVDAFLQTLIL